MLAPSSFVLTFALTHAGGACYACAFILRPYLCPYPCWRSLLCLHLHPSSLPSPLPMLEEPAMLAPSSFVLTFALTHAGGACYACAFILRPYLRPYPCWRSLLCLRLHPSSLPSEHAQTGGACYAWCTQARHQVGRGGVSAASPTPAPSEPETATQFVIVWVSVCVRVCVHLCLRAHMSVYVCTILYCI